MSDTEPSTADGRPRTWIGVFGFTGAQGETVSLALEALPGPDTTGQRATLLLIDQIGRVFFVRADSGALPNGLTATLPAAGRYLVTVAEHVDVPRGRAFRGDYCVTLESSERGVADLRAHGLGRGAARSARPGTIAKSPSHGDGGASPLRPLLKATGRGPSGDPERLLSPPPPRGPW